MNYYDAREKKPEGIWHYTCQNDGVVWPVGYCAERNCQHSTKEEAYNCYKQYLIDNLTFTKLAEWPKNKCEIPECMKAATKFASTPGHMSGHSVCEDHATKDFVKDLIKVGYIMSS